MFYLPSCCITGSTRLSLVVKMLLHLSTVIFGFTVACKAVVTWLHILNFGIKFLFY